MKKRIFPAAIDIVVSPEPYRPTNFTDSEAAVAALIELYDRNTRFLREAFSSLAESGDSTP